MITDAPAVAPQRPIAPPVAAPKTAPVVAENPVFFVPPLMDLVIPEVHKPKVSGVKSARARKRRNLSTVAPMVAPTLPALGAADRRAPPPPPPAPANKNRRLMIITGAVAACLALVAAIAWTALRETPAPDTALSDAEVTTSQVTITPQDLIVAETPPPATVPAVPETVAAVAPGPAVPQINIAGFTVQPDTAVSTPNLPIAAEPAAPLLTVPAQIAVAALPDDLPAPAQPAPEPPAADVAAAEVGAPVLRGTVLSPADAQSVYAATGVWQRAPRFFDIPTETSTDGLIVPFSETVPGRIEQPQVPPATNLETDLSFLAPADPPAAEIQFPVDENGFILATPEGTVTPEGAIVFAGAPDVTVRLRPELSQADIDRMSLLSPAPEGVVVIAGRPARVPPLRPADAALPEPDVAVAEDTPAAQDPTPGAVSLAALEDPASGVLSTDAPDLRPTARPGALASTADPGTPDITSIIAGIAAEDEAALVNATQSAVAASLRPTLRPQNFDRVVAAAQARTAAQPAAAAPVRTAAPVAPQNYAPVPGGVARAATQEDVLPLRQINLIGVYGRPNARRALVRLSNGRYVRVEIGSTLDGGQVTAISENALNYVKRGRTLALQLPNG